MLIDSALEQELQALHDVEGRYWHVWAHPTSMRRLASAHADEIADPEALDAMIVFHDVVYDSRRNDNEERSADEAERLLSGRTSSEVISFVRAGIEATKTHIVPIGLSDPQKHDVAILLDLDLSILGADEVLFDDYDRKIRLEYAWASDEQWRVGRSKVMEGFLHRPHIYHTQSFRDEFEERARKNLRRLVTRLSSED